MYIRKTKVKTGQDGTSYHSYRLVQSTRVDGKVKQRTIINLGKHFDVAPEHWPLFTARIEQILQSESGQPPLLEAALDPALEKSAQHYAALALKKYAQPVAASEHANACSVELTPVNISALDVLQPRSVGVEALCFQALSQLNVMTKLRDLGFNRTELAGAVGQLIGRMTHPASERETHRWLQNTTALGELMAYDYASMSLTRFYAIADTLLDNKDAIEAVLAQREQDLFDLDRTIVLYDLTNTYFEGQAMNNKKAAYGRSKEKRSDCPLVTLGLVLDGEGFPLRSEVFDGNASEPATLSTMLNGLSAPDSATVVLDAGLATQSNIDELKKQGRHYIVVSRERHKAIPSQHEEAVTVTSAAGEDNVTALRVDCPDTGEVRLYCHSKAREQKEQAMITRFSERLEEALDALKQGLTKKGAIKRYDKIVERVGRLKEKFSRVASNYTITVIPDENNTNAASLTWTRNDAHTKKTSEAGVYCLRTDRQDWSEQRLWQTYVMLTELEASFRSMKSELGLRPVYHQKDTRVTAHLFITLLAYHVVHTIRYQLKKKGIHASWQSLRNLFASQQRLTVRLPTREATIHVRLTSKAEPEQVSIFQALGYDCDPIGRTQTSSQDISKNL